MTAVGLVIVALAFNQSWPLIPGSAIPGIPPKHQTVAPATVVARPIPSPTQVGPGRLTRSGPSHAHRLQASTAPSGGAAPVASRPSATVVSQSTPVTPPRNTQQDQSSQDHISPVHRHGGETPTTVAAAPSTPEPTPTSRPSPTPGASPPASTPPVASTVEPPGAESESNLPPWSNGNGHAYGREEDGHGQDWGDDDDSHGHGWGDDDD